LNLNDSKYGRHGVLVQVDGLCYENFVPTKEMLSNFDSNMYLDLNDDNRDIQEYRVPQKPVHEINEDGASSDRGEVVIEDEDSDQEVPAENAELGDEDFDLIEEIFDLDVGANVLVA